MPEGNESKPTVGGDAAAAGTFSFLGNFSRGLFSTTESRTVDHVDTQVKDADGAAEGSLAGFRRVKTLSDFSKFATPEENSSQKAFSTPVVVEPKASVEAPAMKQGSGMGLGLGGMRRVSLGDFTKTFANLNMNAEKNTSAASESLKPPEAGSQPRRGSTVWEWLNTSKPMPQQDAMKPDSSLLGRRHSSAVTEMTQQQQQMLHQQMQQQQQQQQQQSGLGKKKVSYRDLNAYAPSNWWCKQWTGSSKRIIYIASQRMCSLSRLYTVAFLEVWLPPNGLLHVTEKPRMDKKVKCVPGIFFLRMKSGAMC